MKTLPIEALAKQVRGVAYAPEDLHKELDEDSIILLRANNIDDGEINFDDVVFVDKRRVAPAQILQKGDILICASSGSKNLVGKAAAIDFPRPATFGAFCKVVRPLKPEDADYLALFFQCPFYRRKISAAAMGANINNIRNEHIASLPIRWPGAEQRRKAVVILQTIGNLIRKRKVELQQLDELVKARFVEMFGDPVVNSSALEKKPLGERCKIITGNTPSRLVKENFGEFIEWVKSNNLNTPNLPPTKAQEGLSEIGFQQCRHVEAGSILMTCIAGSIGCIGNVALTDRRVAFNQQINAIVPSEDEPLYIYWLMQLSKPTLHRPLNIALKGILSKGQLSRLEFPFPPKTLQQRFATFVSRVETMKLSVEKALGETQVLFDSLMQEYFG